MLKSKKEIESESLKLRTKIFLQIAYAKNLKFLEQDEGSSFEEFVFKYGKAFGEFINDHPEFLELYEKLEQENRASDFDFTEFEKLIKPYLPTIH